MGDGDHRFNEGGEKGGIEMEIDFSINYD